MNFDLDNPLASTAGEPTKANQALNDYALLGPARSLSQLAEQYQTRTIGVPPTKQHSKLKEWSAAWDWQLRVGLFDEEQRAAERAAAVALWQSRKEATRERYYSISERLADRAIEMLGFPLATMERTESVKRSEDGRTTTIMQSIVKPSKWALRDAALIADVAVKLARLSAEMETDRSLLILEGLTTKDLDGMSMEQLQLLKSQLEGRKK